MESWAFYPVFIGTLMSVVGLTRLAVKSYDRKQPRTLSELAAAGQTILVQFRNILVFCDLLFAITVFGFIVPRITQQFIVATFGVLMIGGELLVSLLPARGKTFRVHYVLAQIMAVGMLGLAFLFSIELHSYLYIERVISLSMCFVAVLTFVDKRHYIAYELAYIFFSHLTIVIAAIALH